MLARRRSGPSLYGFFGIRSEHNPGRARAGSRRSGPHSMHRRRLDFPHHAPRAHGWFSPARGRATTTGKVEKRKDQMTNPAAAAGLVSHCLFLTAMLLGAPSVSAILPQGVGGCSLLVLPDQLTLH